MKMHLNYFNFTVITNFTSIVKGGVRMKKIPSPDIFQRFANTLKRKSIVLLRCVDPSENEVLGDWGYNPQQAIRPMLRNEALLAKE